MSRAILQQGEVWIDAADRVHVLDEMDPRHRANLIPFLRGNAMTVAAASGVETVDRHEAEEWLANTPLMRRLCELEHGRSIEDRRADEEANRAYEAMTGYQKVRLG